MEGNHGGLPVWMRAPSVFLFYAIINFGLFMLTTQAIRGQFGRLLLCSEGFPDTWILLGIECALLTGDCFGFAGSSVLRDRRCADELSRQALSFKFHSVSFFAGA